MDFIARRWSSDWEFDVDKENKADLLWVDTVSIDFEDLIQQLNELDATHILPPYKVDDTNWSAKVLGNFTNHLPGKHVVAGVCGTSRKERKEYVKYLRDAGRMMFWDLHNGILRRGRIIYELDTEGFAFTTTHFFLNTQKGDARDWPMIPSWHQVWLDV